MGDLICRDTVFVSDGLSQEEVFEDVSRQLVEKDLVSKDFLKNLLERERQYPTGLDLTPVHPLLTNIAIPHTESEFVKTTRIVPIKLINPIEFYNMINPEEVLQVSFLFMILNGNGEAQAGLLACIMDFINATNYQNLLELFSSTNTQEIYDFLNKNLKETI